MSSTGTLFLPILTALAATLASAPTSIAGTSPLDDGPAQPASDARSKPAETLFVRAKRLITRPGEVIEDAQVIVRDGKIASFGRELALP